MKKMRERVMQICGVALSRQRTSKYKGLGVEVNLACLRNSKYDLCVTTIE